MAKVSQKYETIIVFTATLPEEETKALVEKFQTMITDNGTMITVDEWGKRRLAYEINDESEGFYVLFQYECKPDFPQELDRICKITDGILRWMTVTIE